LCRFIGAQWPHVAGGQRVAYSAAAVVACGACAWSFSAALAAWVARDHDHARRCVFLYIYIYIYIYI
jgi:hypothetical protein